MGLGVLHSATESKALGFGDLSVGEVEQLQRSVDRLFSVMDGFEDRMREMMDGPVSKLRADMAALSVRVETLEAAKRQEEWKALIQTGITTAVSGAGGAGTVAIVAWAGGMLG